MLCCQNSCENSGYLKKAKADFQMLYKWPVYDNLDKTEDLIYYHHLFVPCFFLNFW